MRHWRGACPPARRQYTLSAAGRAINRGRRLHDSAAGAEWAELRAELLKKLRVVRRVPLLLLLLRR